jgi:hypothetical protein
MNKSMSLYKKLNLPHTLVEEIKNCALAEMQDIQFGSMQLYFLKKPQYVLGMYLKQHYPVLPSLYNCILFYRPGDVQQELHIDCDNSEPPKLMQCAINIPILNCDDSYMEWYHGDYSTSVNAVQGNDGITRKFINLNWQQQPHLIEKVIIDAPTLVRVNVPHRITKTTQTRGLITMRFAGNPDFNQIEKLFS